MDDPELDPFPPASVALSPASRPWTRIPYDDAPRFDARTVAAHWDRLHAGQGLQPPAPGPLAEGWAAYHSGDFERAADIGLQHGREGQALADQATAIYADYLEPRETVRLSLFKAVFERAAALSTREPDNCHALFWQAYVLGRYSQGISVARALAQGLGGKVKAALERVIELQPGHADAHIALAAFHAEVIDKVGPLVGRMTYGARTEVAVELFERGIQLNPQSARGLIEYGRGLLMLYGDSRMAEATRLYQRAASLPPRDARERLDIELARAGLSD